MNVARFVSEIVDRETSLFTGTALLTCCALFSPFSGRLREAYLIALVSAVPTGFSYLVERTAIKVGLAMSGVLVASFVSRRALSGRAWDAPIDEDYRALKVGLTAGAIGIALIEQLQLNPLWYGFPAVVSHAIAVHAMPLPPGI